MLWLLFCLVIGLDFAAFKITKDAWQAHRCSDNETDPSKLPEEVLADYGRLVCPSKEDFILYRDSIFFNPKGGNRKGRGEIERTAARTPAFYRRKTSPFKG